MAVTFTTFVATSSLLTPQSGFTVLFLVFALQAHAVAHVNQGITIGRTVDLVFHSLNSKDGRLDIHSLTIASEDSIVLPLPQKLLVLEELPQAIRDHPYFKNCGEDTSE